MSQVEGVVFPVSGADGARSSTATGRAVFADAARAVAPAVGDAIEAERDWRRGYPRHVRALVEAGVASPDGELRLAREGLASLHSRLEFVRGGECRRLLAAASSYAGPDLDTVEVRGEGEHPGGLEVPYRGERLRGAALERQLDAWVAAGVAEPSMAAAVRRVVATPEWLDLSDETVVVLGAGAELGPLHPLCRWGARVVAVDLPGGRLQARIVETARGGSGRVSLPARAGRTGADLLVDLPELARWLARLPGRLTVGGYAYADGATHVRVAMAVDALTLGLVRDRPDTAVAVLATPTDVYPVPAEVVAESRRRYAARGPGSRLGSRISGARVFAPNYPDRAVADCLVLQQGAGYALAKQLQRWRASLLAADGQVVSANVAPPTRTRSVLKNRALAAAYAGAGRFGVEVFDPPTSNTLMAALLVHDLRVGGRPGRRPAELFAESANSGGLWRQPYAPRSVLGLAVGLGMLTRPRR